MLTFTGTTLRSRIYRPNSTTDCSLLTARSIFPSINSALYSEGLNVGLLAYIPLPWFLQEYIVNTSVAAGEGPGHELTQLLEHVLS